MASVDATTCEVALLVERMRCGACVWLLETWLSRQPGVVRASVNFATRRARVRFDAAQTSLAAILRAVAAIGYRAHAYDPARREALARAEQRALVPRAGLALLAMMQVMMFAIPTYVSVDGVDAEYRALLAWASLALTLPVVLYCAGPFFAGAWRGLRHRIPGMDVPIALGIAGAFAASAWATVSGRGDTYFDSITMFIALVLVARWIEQRVRHRAGDALEAIARERPATAERLADYPRADVTQCVAASELSPGDHVRIAAGATVPADGVVVDGRSRVEEALLTGESWPRAKVPGDRVMAGSVNRESPLVVRVTAVGEATALGALARFVERAASERPRIARMADRVAAHFVIALLGVAGACAIGWWFVDPERALPAVLAVLIVSCPCALSLATPAAIASAAAALLRRQVLCVRADALERLSRVTHVVLDKTGTLTTGEMRLTGIAPMGSIDAASCLAIAAALERGSDHPIARALRDHATPACVPLGVLAVPGFGVEGMIGGIRYRLGRESWVAEIAEGRVDDVAELAATDRTALGETSIALGSAAGRLAMLRFGERVRDSARPLVTALRAAGLRVTLLSGDRAAAVAHVANAVGIEDWQADATPRDKQATVATLQRQGGVVAMVGDGLNDAPSLACADVSLTLSSAAALTQWTADVVVLGNDLSRVAFALHAARRAFRTIRQNFGWALAYNAVAIPLAAAGHLSPLAAAAGMSLSSLVVVGNAWRLSRVAAAPIDAAPMPRDPPIDARVPAPS